MPTVPSDLTVLPRLSPLEVRAWRKRRGLSTAQLARRLGVTERAVNMWQSDRWSSRSPWYLAAAPLARLSGCGGAVMRGRTIMLDYPRIARYLVCIFCGWPRRPGDPLDLRTKCVTVASLADHFAAQHGRVVVG